ncbi:MAG TPA: tripartite tricarboxylate transporter substrate binding protein [Modicisalibacter sp.]|nr:tripartite tricarboxylate transporter substrate binding protein [Modicisalibacter sp.]
MYDTKSLQKSVRTMRHRWLALSLSLFAGVCFAQTETNQAGQAELDRPITYIVAFGPGGGSDQVARASAQALAKGLGVELPVVNVPGATGNIGMNQLVSSPPGRAMAILIQDTLATVPFGTSSFQLDQIQGVCRLQRMPSALLVKSGTYESWEDLKAAAKAGQAKVATVGRNSIDSLMLAALGEAQGVEFRKIPFANPSERYVALLGGAVDALYDQLGDVRQYVESGQYEPLIIFSNDPIESFKDVTHATDLGVPEEAILTQFRGIVMPAKTDPAVIQTVSKACSGIMEDPKFQQFQEAVLASEESYMPADEFETYIDQQAEIIGRLMEKYLATD